MAAGDVMSLVLKADLAEVATARHFVRRHLSAVPDVVAADAQLIVSELVTNAVEHGLGGPVRMAICQHAHRVDLTVESVGPSPEVGVVDAWELADVEEVTGRGLGIVRKVADDVEVERSPRRLVITATLSY